MEAWTFLGPMVRTDTNGGKEWNILRHYSYFSSYSFSSSTTPQASACGPDILIEDGMRDGAFDSQIDSYGVQILSSRAHRFCSFIPPLVVILFGARLYIDPLPSPWTLFSRSSIPFFSIGFMPNYCRRHHRASQAMPSKMLLPPPSQACVRCPRHHTMPQASSSS